jgi:hypothetical protein
MLHSIERDARSMLSKIDDKIELFARSRLKI